jgi:hypothetical protein
VTKGRKSFLKGKPLSGLALLDPSDARPWPLIVADYKCQSVLRRDRGCIRLAKWTGLEEGFGITGYIRGDG